MWLVRQCCWAIVSLVTVLTGCTVNSSTKIDQERSLILASESDARRATLYLLYDIKGPTLARLNTEVTANGIPIAILSGGDYKRVFLKPQTYELRWQLLKSTIDLTEGQTCYVLMAYNSFRSWAWPFAGDAYTMNQISQEEAGMLIKELTPK